MVTIEYGIGELADPVAENHKARLLGEHQVEFDVAMTKHEVIDVRMGLEIVFGKENKVLFVFTHIRGFLAVCALEA